MLKIAHSQINFGLKTTFYLLMGVTGVGRGWGGGWGVRGKKVVQVNFGKGEFWYMFKDYQSDNLELIQ